MLSLIACLSLRAITFQRFDPETSFFFFFACTYFFSCLGQVRIPRSLGDDQDRTNELVFLHYKVIFTSFFHRPIFNVNITN